MSYSRNLRGEPGAPMRGRIRSVGRFPNAGKSLAKRRRWYADGEEDTPEDENQPGADDAEDGGESDESDDDSPVPKNVEDLPDWAQKLLKGARDEAASNRVKLREIEDAQNAQKLKDAEDQGKYKELWEGSASDREELEALRAEKVTRLENLKERNETRIEKLPKDVQQTARDIIETAGTDDPDKVSALLDKLIPTLGTQQEPPPKDGGSKGDSRQQTGSTKVKLNNVSY